MRGINKRSCLRGLMLLFVFYTRIDGGSPCSDADQEAIVSKLLLENGYNHKVSPSSFLGHTVNVELSMFMTDMTRVDDSLMEMSSIILFRQTWVDPRLKHTHLDNCSSVVVHRNDHRLVWQPDLYFANSRHTEIHEYTARNQLLWVYSDGRIFMSTKYTVTTSCPMNLQRFPFDTQYCKLIVESYGYTNKHLNLTFKEGKAFMLPRELNLPKFHLTGFEHGPCNYLYGGTDDAQCAAGCTPCVEIDLKLQREYGFHILAVYIPTTFIVIVSWVSFWVSHESIPGRVSLGVTTLLTITTQGVVSTLSQPQVPYVKLVDIWLSTCCVFVFGVLFEYALINVLQRKNLRHKQYVFDMARQHTSANDGKQEMQVKNTRSCCRLTPQSVDKFCRVAFPVAFFSFATFYWVYALAIVQEKQYPQS